MIEPLEQITLPIAYMKINELVEAITLLEARQRKVEKAVGELADIKGVRAKNKINKILK